MTSRDYFLINGVSSHTKNLYVDTPPMIQMPQQSYDVVTIPDREETLYYAKDIYEDITVSITAYTFSNSFDISSVYAWLRDAEELVLSNSLQRYYKIKKVLGIIPNYSGHGKNVITISFVCSPFRYHRNDSTVTITSPASFSLNNTGSYWSRPVYKVYGSGNITLSAGGNSITVYEVTDSCIIDSERLIVYKETETNGIVTRTLMASSGTIPTLETGTVNFTTATTGTCTKIEIKKNLRDR